MAGVDLRHIDKSFGHTHVLRKISLTINDGEFVVLLGPSGCGKSTLLRIIAGLERQTSGSVLIDGRVVDSTEPRDRDIAMVFQQYALYPHLTVRENLAFGLKMRHEPKTEIAARIQEAAELLDIHNLLDRRPKELSGGQRQRVAMGRALVRKPKLFLFDEPLSNLDARLRTSTRVELKKLHQRLGATMIYVTHDQVEAMTLGQTIVIMEQGHIRQIGSPRTIYDTPETPFVAGFIGSPPMNLLSGTLTPDGSRRTFQAGRFILALPDSWSVSLPADSTPVVLGIRPEDISFQPLDEPALSVNCTVDIVENLGADQLIYVTVQGQTFVCRTASGQVFQAGSSLALYLPTTKLHLFINDKRISF